ncbi:MAG: laccase domain-containing protein [Candidatus Hydrogenedentota bacterium]|nr:MAG: laccase domain-containing protein [Candidatus Hydrogenedentota bacterium]
MKIRTATVTEDMRIPETGGDFDRALENYVVFLKDFGIRDGFVCRQVHGTAVLEAGGAVARPILPTVVGEGDAIWTSRPGTWVGVFAADCLPVLFEMEDRVMAVHAGWRGLSAGILRTALDFLGGARAVKRAWLGAAARKCCYEVGDEVVSALQSREIEPVLEGKNLDLPDTAQSWLEKNGVAPVERLEPFGCTICDRRFHSFRRDGAKSGRNLCVIGIEKE